MSSPITAAALPFASDLAEDKAASDEKISDGEVASEAISYSQEGEEVFRQYWYRWVGLFGITLTNFAVGMNTVWFASPFVSILMYFELEVYPLNWTFNIANISLIVLGCFVPFIVQRVGVRNTCWAGTAFLFLATWIRYAATQHVASGYALLVFGQVLLGFASCMLGIIGPKFVEIWFNERSRTSATAVYSVGGVAGQLAAQLAAPRLIVEPTDVPHGFLICAIMTTVFCLSCFGVLSAPPTPPTFTATKKTLSFVTTAKNLLGFRVELEVEGREPMTWRERLDFLILAVCWSLITGTVATQQNFIAQILVPLGYDAATAGNMASVVIGSGVAFTILVGPIFDRLNHLALVLKVGSAGICAACIGFVFAAKPDNASSLYAVMAFLGALTFAASPIVLELGAELVRSPEVATMVFTVGAAIWSIASVEIVGNYINPVDSTLRGGLVYMAIVSGISLGFSIFLKGEQRRKQTDISKRKNAGVQA